MTCVPVLAIDGPSGSGKGTIGQRVALELNWHYLDSGALYRAFALSTLDSQVDVQDPRALGDLAGKIVFSCAPVADGHATILLNGRDVSDTIRGERVAAEASKFAALPEIRTRLLQTQRNMAQLPGLVADGRDMGSTVFPQSNCKIFLTASAEARAQRRHNELKDKGFGGTVCALLRDIKARDERDASRSVSPMGAASDAVILDSTNLTIDEVVSRVLSTLAASLNTSFD